MYQIKVNLSLTFIQKLGYKAGNCEMVYYVKDRFSMCFLEMAMVFLIHAIFCVLGV